MKMVFLFIFFLTSVSAFSQGMDHEVQLKHQQFVWKSKTKRIQFLQYGNKQFLETQNTKTGKKVQQIMVWSGVLKGELSRMSSIYSSKKYEILKLYGMNGNDSRFYEIIAWEPSSGEMFKMLSTFNYDVFSMNQGQASIVFSVIPIDDDAHNDHLQLNSRNVESPCKEKMEKLTLLEREKWQLLKIAGRTPSSQESQRINQIEVEKDKFDLSTFTFDMTTFSDIKASCK